jgi:CRP-like cAMP-binding protein
LLLQSGMGVIEILERSAPLAGVTRDVVSRLAPHASIRRLEHGDYLWRTGEMPHSLGIIRNGLLKLVRSSARGRSAICGLFGPYESLGEVELVTGAAYAADAWVTSQSANIVLLPREVVMAEAKLCPSFALALASAAHPKIIALYDKIEVLSAGSVDARMATLLLKLYEKFGDDFEDGTSRIPVSLSRRELADFVSTSFETAIRVMRRWERDRIVETLPHGFVLHDLNALEAIASAPSAAVAAAE